ncbi:unnamed protein product [Pleuronectes platessa]|uniref:Uncharacterized protein n=1 Tax=Pleuronectes platessa TaxID=8262 RepID=A0A9N7VH54_PLEPL|nr:unnamed protein product [Pleuronectes platessa]
MEKHPENAAELRKVYLVTPLCAGGELMQLLERKKCFTEDETRHIICSSPDAVVSLHNGGNVILHGKPTSQPSAKQHRPQDGEDGEQRTDITAESSEEDPVKVEVPISVEEPGASRLSFTASAIRGTEERRGKKRKEEERRGKKRKEGKEEERRAVLMTDGSEGGWVLTG